MKNNTIELNNYLFAQIERLDDESLSGEALNKEINRGNAIANIASQMVANGNLQLKVITVAHEMGVEVNAPAFLQIAGVDKK